MGVLGITYTEKFEDVSALDQRIGSIIRRQIIKFVSTYMLPQATFSCPLLNQS